MGRDAVTERLINLLCKRAQDLLRADVEAEKDAFLAEFAKRRTSNGRASGVGSGDHSERSIQTGIGPFTVTLPKVKAKDGKPLKYCWALVPLGALSGRRGLQ